MNNEYVAIKKEDLFALRGYVCTLLDFIDIESFQDKNNVELVNAGYDDFVKPIENILRDGNPIGDEILAKDVDIRLFKEQLSDLYSFDVSDISDQKITKMYNDLQERLSCSDDYGEIYNDAVFTIIKEAECPSLLDQQIQHAEAIKESCGFAVQEQNRFLKKER